MEAWAQFCMELYTLGNCFKQQIYPIPFCIWEMLRHVIRFTRRIILRQTACADSTTRSPWQLGAGQARQAGRFQIRRRLRIPVGLCKGQAPKVNVLIM